MWFAGWLPGLITSEDLTVVEGDSASPLVTASDVMRPAASVALDDTLLTALDTLRAERLPELPVLDATGRVVGFVDEASIASAYLRRMHPSHG